MVQTAAVTRSFPSNSGCRPRRPRDYAGVGAGNLLAAMLGAFPVDASPPSTAITAQSGARSQLACLFAVAIFAGLLMFGTGLLAHVPRAALAGVLMFVGASLIRVPQIVAIWRYGGQEFVLMLVTLLLIVLLPIETGMVLGIALAFAQACSWWQARDRPPGAAARAPATGYAPHRPAGRAGPGRARDADPGAAPFHQRARSGAGLDLR